jgi:hypothetical protein
MNPVGVRSVAQPDIRKWSSDRAPVGKEMAHLSLTRDGILGQFSRKRTKAENEYRRFVAWGIGKGTIGKEEG